MAFQPQTRTARCDRFKPSGKWYDEFELDMSLEQGAITAPRPCAPRSPEPDDRWGASPTARWSQRTRWRSRC